MTQSTTFICTTSRQHCHFTRLQHSSDAAPPYRQQTSYIPRHALTALSQCGASAEGIQVWPALFLGRPAPSCRLGSPSGAGTAQGTPRATGGPSHMWLQMSAAPAPLFGIPASEAHSPAHEHLVGYWRLKMHVSQDCSSTLSPTAPT